MFKFSNRTTRTRCEICSKSTIKTPEWRPHRGVLLLVVKLQAEACNVTKSNTPPWGRRSDVVIVTFNTSIVSIAKF